MNYYLQTERELKGYVEIEYSDLFKFNNDNLKREETIPTTASIIKFPQNEYVEGLSYDDYNIISENYASLEENYFLLDGSFILPNDGYNFNTGYISEEIKNNYEFIINYTENDVYLTNGMTFYFKDNIPQNFNIEFEDQDGIKTVFEYTNADIKDYVLNVNFNSKLSNPIINIKQIKFIVSNMEEQNRRLRISKINYGISSVIRNEKLIDFTVKNSRNEFNTEFPSSELIINMFDEENLFDLNNPKGIANLLKVNHTLLKPSIGIKTLDKGFVYTNKGNFYLTSWTCEKNNVTINCNDGFFKLKNTPMEDIAKIGISANYGNLDNYYALEGFNSSIQSLTDLEIDNFTNFADGRYGTSYYDDTYVSTGTVMEYLQLFMCWVWGTMYFKNNLETYALNENKAPYDYTLTKDTALLEEPKYTIKENLKKISITQYKGYNLTDVKESIKQANVIYETTVGKALNDNSAVDLGGYYDVTVVCGDTINQNIGITKYVSPASYIPVNYTLTQSIIFYNMGNVNFTTSTYVDSVNNNGIELNIDNKFFKEYGGKSGSFAQTLDETCSNICDRIKSMYKKYDVEINYIGDANITIDDTIKAETQYGIREVRILEHDLTFNGGLSGTIKGVGD